MPQLIAIALVGGVAWYAWRAFRKEMARIGKELHGKDRGGDRFGTKEGGPTMLEQGEDGVWRPKRDDPS